MVLGFIYRGSFQKRCYISIVVSNTHHFLSFPNCSGLITPVQHRIPTKNTPSAQTMGPRTGFANHHHGLLAYIVMILTTPFTIAPCLTQSL